MVSFAVLAYLYEPARMTFADLVAFLNFCGYLALGGRL
jgi:hypothetical protein